MLEQQIIEEIKKVVHQPLNWEEYESSSKCRLTNCFAHAIGNTSATVHNSDSYEAHRLGMISGLKQKNEKYISKQEVKELFLSDIAMLDLQAEEILFENKWSFFGRFSDIQLEKNQHVVVLFVKLNRNEIEDFHFLRFDLEIGWSEKRWCFKPYVFEDIFKEWPSDFELVGVYKITR